MKFKIYCLFLLMLLLLLGACCKHEKVDFKIKYECTNHTICSIILVPLDSFYQQDLVVDQLLYSKEFHDNEYKTNIKWSTPEESATNVVDNNVLKANQLPVCSDNKCSFYSNPTGLLFNTSNKKTEIHVEGQATVKGVNYPINLSTMIEFADIKAPTIDQLGKCDNSNLKCNFIVSALPSGGVPPYEYRWFLNDTQIAQTKSDDKNGGQLTYEFERLSSGDSLSMIAVDKNGNHSAESNKKNLLGPNITSIDVVGPKTIPYSSSSTQTITYSPHVSGGAGDNVFTLNSSHITGTYSDITAATVNSSSGDITLTVKAGASGSQILASDIILTVTDKDNNTAHASPSPANNVTITGSAAAPSITSIDVVGPKTIPYSSSSTQTITYRPTVSGGAGDNVFTLNSSHITTAYSDITAATVDSSSGDITLTVKAGASGEEILASDIILTVTDKDNNTAHASPSYTNNVTITGSAAAPSITSIDVVGPKTIPYNSSSTQTITYSPHVSGGAGDNVFTLNSSHITGTYSDITAATVNSSSGDITLTVKAGASGEEILASDIILTVTDKDNNTAHASPSPANNVTITGSAAAPSITSIDVVGPKTIPYSSSSTQTITYRPTVSGGAGDNVFTLNSSHITTAYSDITAATVDSSSGDITLTVKAGASGEEILASDIILTVTDKDNNTAHASPSYTNNVTITGSAAAPSITSIDVMGPKTIPYNSSSTQTITYSPHVSGGAGDNVFTLNSSHITGTYSDITAATVNSSSGDITLTVKAGASGEEILASDIILTVTDKDNNTAHASPSPANNVTITGSAAAPSITSIDVVGPKTIPYSSSSTQTITYRPTVSGGAGDNVFTLNSSHITTAYSDITAATVDSSSGDITLTVKAGASGEEILASDIILTVTDKDNNTAHASPSYTNNVTITGSAAAPSITSIDVVGPKTIPYNSSSTQTITYSPHVSGGAGDNVFTLNSSHITGTYSDITAATVNSSSGDITLTVKAGASGEEILASDIILTVTDKDNNTAHASPSPANNVTITGSAAAPSITSIDVVGPKTIPYSSSSTQTITYSPHVSGGAGDNVFTLNSSHITTAYSDITAATVDSSSGDITLTVKAGASGEEILASDIILTVTDKDNNTAHASPSYTNNVTITGSAAAPSITSIDVVGPKTIPYNSSSTQTITYSPHVSGGAGDNVFTLNSSHITGTYSDITAATVNSSSGDITLTVKAGASGEEILASDIILTVTDKDNNTAHASPSPANNVTITGSAAAPSITSIDVVGPKTIPYSSSSTQTITYSPHVSGGAGDNVFTLNSSHITTAYSDITAATVNSSSGDITLTVKAGATGSQILASDIILTVKDKDNNTSHASPSPANNVTITGAPRLTFNSVQLRFVGNSLYTDGFTATGANLQYGNNKIALGWGYVSSGTNNIQGYMSNTFLNYSDGTQTYNIPANTPWVVHTTGCTNFRSFMQVVVTNSSNNIIKKSDEMILFNWDYVNKIVYYKGDMTITGMSTTNFHKCT